MATLKICKLHFKSPLHIGDRKNDDYGNSLKTVSSDTMYAALTSVLAKSGNKIPEDGNLGFAISSLFPFYQQSADSESAYFFPQPLQAKMPRLADIGIRKKIKKVQWLDSGYFERVLNGERLFDGNTRDIDHVQGAYLSSKTLPEGGFVCSQVSERVTMPSRINEVDTVPYYVDRVSFKDNSGLFFIVEGDDSLLQKALPLLSEEGIGTDRNVGNGFFDYEFASLDIVLPAKSEYALSLSLYIPESKAQVETLISSDQVAFDIDRRGGWITTYPFQTLRKNAIYGFVAGCVFRYDMTDKTDVLGRIVDLRPNISFVGEPLHPIWRSGKTILLPIKL